MPANDPYGVGTGAASPADPYGVGVSAPQAPPNRGWAQTAPEKIKRGAKRGLEGIEGYLMGKAIPSAGAAIGNVLNTTSRFGVGAANKYLSDDTGEGPEHVVTDIPGAIAAGLSAAARPSSLEENTTGLEANLGLGGLTGVPKAVADFGLQTALDPLTLAGEGVGKGLYGLGDAAIKQLWKRSPAIETLLRPNALVRSRLSPEEAAKTEGIVDREKMLDRQVKEDEKRAEEARGKLPPQHKPQVKAPDPTIPKWAAPWRHVVPEDIPHTPTRRMEQMAASASERKAPVLKQGRGILGRQGTKLGVADVRAPVNANLTRDEIRENRIKAALNKEGLPYVQNLERDPAGSWQAMNRWLSNLGKDVLFTNSVPHMGNIGALVWLHGGEATLARGLKHFSDPKFYRADNPGSIVEELEEFGGHTHFSKDPRIIGKIPVLGNVSRASQGLLDRWEAAMRGAMYEHELAQRGLKPLGRTAFRGMSQEERDARFAAAAEARRIADYTNTNAATRFLTDNLGAPFAQWKGLAMPSSVVRGTVRHPQRAARMARLGGVINQDIVPQNRPELESGKPNEEAWKLATQPGKYAASESLLGPIVGPLVNAAIYHQTFPEMLSETAQGYLPFAGATQAAAGLNPFHQPGSRLTRAAESLVGMHERKRPPGRLVFPANPADPYGVGTK